MAQRPWKKYLTENEYSSLTYPGKVLAEYWAEFLPKMTAELKASGDLFRILDAEGDRLADLEMDLIRESGLEENQAWEVVMEQIYSLPPEE